MSASGVARHLRGSHGVKSDTLRAAVLECESLTPNDPRQYLPAADGPPLPYLPIKDGYRCGFIACKDGEQVLSLNRRTIEKHLAGEHNVGARRPRIPVEAHHLEVVRLQSLLPSSNYRPFAVRAAA